MDHFQNTGEYTDRVLETLRDVPVPSADATRVQSLLERCPHAGVTELRDMPGLARLAGVGSVHVKDERTRMGLGSFKALGAAYVIACDAQSGEARGQTYITASAGNHGLSVAAGASAFGAQAIVVLAETVPESFAERLRGHGAEVRRIGETYEEGMTAARELAETQGWILLSDSSWPGYMERPYLLMEGYLALMQEVVGQIPAPPTHIFLQAGVGGLAGAAAAYARAVWEEAPRIVIVEPETAPALIASMRAGQAVVAPGPVSAMGRLDCKEPSLIALKGLARDANDFITISEAAGGEGHHAAIDAGLPSTPSGAAGLAGLLAAREDPGALGLDAASRVLIILSEDAEA